MLEIFCNVYVWSAVAGWFGAQIIKIVTHIVRDKRFSFKMLMESGGMPSSHAAAACSVAAAIAATGGAKTPEFAVACLFAYIVMYDAAGVRYETGEQARILNKISSDLASDDTKFMDRDLNELVGHTPLQVVAGAALGILIGIFFPMLWRVVFGL